jgi:DnaJ-class molecular chaperone
LNGNVRGDQLVRVIVWTPDELTPEQERALTALREVESAAPAKVSRRAHKGFWSKVKEAFTGG